MTTENPPEKETKEQAFIRVADPKARKVLEAIRVLGTVTDTTRYEYSRETIDKIFDAIQAALGDVFGQFNRGINVAEFSLDLEPSAPEDLPEDLPIIDGDEPPPAGDHI